MLKQDAVSAVSFLFRRSNQLYPICMQGMDTCIRKIDEGNVRRLVVNCSQDRRVGPSFLDNCHVEPRADSRMQLFGTRGLPGDSGSSSGTDFATHFQLASGSKKEEELV